MTQTLSDAREARSRASLALREANLALARAVSEAQAQGLRGQALADLVGMTRAGVSDFLKRYAAGESHPRR